MKMRKSIIFLMLVLIFALMICGCNSEQSTNESTDKADIMVTSSESQTTEAVVTEEKATDAEIFGNSDSVGIIPDEDDLEIMTVPHSEPSEQKDKTEPASNAPDFTETEPVHQNTQPTEKTTYIELPFIPV